jgi:hypothetical protein
MIGYYLVLVKVGKKFPTITVLKGPLRRPPKAIGDQRVRYWNGQRWSDI